MMWIDLIQQVSVLDISAGMPLHFTGWESLDLSGLLHLGNLSGQQFDTDVFRGARGMLNRFIESGQLWAFLIGLVVGYIVRAATTYG